MAVQGRVGRDLKVHTTTKGKRIVRTAIAIGQRKRNQTSGHWEDDVTMWLEAVAFGSDMDSFEKGDKVLISGRLAYREWEGRDEVMKTWEVLVDSATLISKPKPKAETDLPNTPEDEYPE